MLDVFGLILSVFSGFFNFLDSFEILDGISLLRLISVILVFYLSIYFLVNRKG